ncbi:SLC13 family permease [Luteolibacter arcticus]|uniref:SLC13 family permease n=1 Tax=Luteolibacter arcticus TaxID=1581411 RepID=A0ABT3GIL1_9BACT|nr:SLC13 family permease [Luteolibacter arcticus]MCW1923334.1 SLC13 family permease [Luteolibacter arcticus]
MDEERPQEDPAREAARPFFRRRDTWLLLAGLALLPLGLLLPIDPARHAGAGLDPAKVKLGLGIFFCIGFLWISEALPLAITALLVPVLATLTGVMDLKSAMAGFADPLIFLFFGGFALSSAMAAQGLDRWIADRIVLAGKGDFLRVSYLVFATTAGLSMWMSNTATTAIMIPLVIGILGQIRCEGNMRGNAIYLLLGTAYAASIGGLGTLVGTPPNGIAAAKLEIGFVEWLRFGLPSMLLLLPLMIVVLRFSCRPQAAIFTKPEFMRFTWTRSRIVTLVIFASAGLCWIFGGLIAPRLGIANSFDTLVALLVVVALVVTRAVSWKQVEAGTEWGVLLLFGGGIVLSAVLDKTGSSLFLAREIVSLVAWWPVIVIIAISLAFVIVLGEFSSNTATAALMVPIFYSVAKELGIEPSKLVIPLALASSCGFMLPVATPPNAIVYATGRIPQREMLRAGAWLDGVCLVVVSLLAWWVF